MTNERDLAKRDLVELNVKYTSLVHQNQKLIDQLKILEQESFEIQARIRRGIEVERENENITKTVDQYKENERE